MKKFKHKYKIYSGGGEEGVENGFGDRPGSQLTGKKEIRYSLRTYRNRAAANLLSILFTYS